MKGRVTTYFVRLLEEERHQALDLGKSECRSYDSTLLKQKRERRRGGKREWSFVVSFDCTERALRVTAHLSLCCSPTHDKKIGS